MTEEMARWCSILAGDRAGSEVISLPLPTDPECNDLFRAIWAAFRHTTTELGKIKMRELGLRDHDNDKLEAFVHGKAIPAYLRWAATEAMIRAGEWSCPP